MTQLSNHGNAKQHQAILGHSCVHMWLLQSSPGPTCSNSAPHRQTRERSQCSRVLLPQITVQLFN